MIRGLSVCVVHEGRDVLYGLAFTGEVGDER